MLCPAKLLRKGKDFRRLGRAVSDDDDYDTNVALWIKAIEEDKMAMELIENGKIDNGRNDP